MCLNNQKLDGYVYVDIGIVFLCILYIIYPILYIMQFSNDNIFKFNRIIKVLLSDIIILSNFFKALFIAIALLCFYV